MQNKEKVKTFIRSPQTYKWIPLNKDGQLLWSKKKGYGQVTSRDGKSSMKCISAEICHRLDLYDDKYIKVQRDESTLVRISYMLVFTYLDPLESGIQL